MPKHLLIVLALSTLLFSCKKEHINNECDTLEEGIAANDLEKVKTAMTSFIAALSSSDYTESNINRLCQRISSNCGVVVEPVCFNCIQTLPEQTEIKISFPDGRSSVIDLSYNTSNKIVFRNMHN